MAGNNSSKRWNSLYRTELRPLMSNLGQKEKPRFGLGQTLIAAFLFVVLIAAAVMVAVAWRAVDVNMPASAWVALVLGVLFSLVIGCGLMALMFFSSRQGYDEAANPSIRKKEPAPTTGSKDGGARPTP